MIAVAYKYEDGRNTRTETTLHIGKKNICANSSSAILTRSAGIFAPSGKAAKGGHVPVFSKAASTEFFNSMFDARLGCACYSEATAKTQIMNQMAVQE